MVDTRPPFDLAQVRAIDIHTHAERSLAAGPPPPFEGRAPLGLGAAGPPAEDVARYYRDLGIVCVIFPVDTESVSGIPPVPNEEVAAAAAANGDVLIPFASIDPGRGVRGVLEARRLVAEHERLRELPLTLPQLIEVQCARYGERPFLRFEDKLIRYCDLPGRVYRLANGLRDRGVRKGDRVAIISSNRVEFELLWLAIACLGAVEVPINTAYKGPFLAYAIENSGASHIVIEHQFLDPLLAVSSALAGVRAVTVLDPAALPRLPHAEVCAFDELAVDDEHAPQVELGPHDPVALAYTSGTTGASKGVLLSHGYFCLLGRDHVKYRELVADDTLYNPLPLFHMNAQTLTVMPALSTGACVALDRRFSASRFWERIRAMNATQFNFVGAMINILWRQPARPNDRDQPARIAFGGPIPPEVLTGSQERWGLRLIEGFGSTESGIVAWQPRSDPRPGSVGVPVPEYDVSLVDDQDNPVAMGEAGEIVTRPLRPFSMMSAYHGMAEQTVAAWRNLWFHTGDMARQDADGYLYFVDRKKDAIRRRGENISSAELESALMSHGGFVETAIVAVPSPLGEDDVKAFLVLAPGVPFEFAEFIAWCEDQLPAFMIPRYVELVADLPRTPTQRVERYRLRKRGNGPRTWDREIEGFVGIIGDQTVVESPAESPSNLV